MILKFAVTFALLFSAVNNAQLAPVAGNATAPTPAWRIGPKTATTDVSPSAGLDGRFSFAGKTYPARLYLACSGAIPAAGDMLVQRIFFKPPQGFPKIDQTAPDMQHMDGTADKNQYPSTIQSMKSLGTGIFFEPLMLAAEADEMLLVKPGQTETLVNVVTTPSGPAEFSFLIPPPSKPLQDVLDSCKFIPKGDGTISPGFAHVITPILKEYLALRMHGPVPESLTAEVKSAQSAVKSQTDLGYITLLNFTVNGYIAGEKTVTDTTLRKRCLQGTIDEVARGKASTVPACGKLEPAD